MSEILFGLAAGGSLRADLSNPMKLTPRHLFAAVLFGLLLAPVLSYADYMPAERQLERLENIVTLSSTQKSEALQIYQNLKDVMDDMNPTDRPVKGAQSRQDALAAIRSILTPGQQKIYDQTPQRLGGDLGTDPVMRNLHQKISVFVTSYVRTSPAIAAQVGTVQQVFPVNGGSTTNWNGGSGR